MGDLHIELGGQKNEPVKHKDNSSPIERKRQRKPREPIQDTGMNEESGDLEKEKTPDDEPYGDDSPLLNRQQQSKRGELFDPNQRWIQKKQTRSNGKVTMLEHFCLASYWFGWSFLWLPLLVVIIPLQIIAIAGNEAKGSTMSYVYLGGSFISLFCAPVFGSMSDSCRNQLGRRRPFMILGTLIATLALFVMAISPSLGWFSTAFLVLSIANNMIIAPYSALIPDYVPSDQRGVASGWLGGMSMIGYIMGGIVSYYVDQLTIFGAYAIMICVHALSMGITCYMADETPIEIVQSPDTIRARFVSFFTPFEQNDFRIVFFTRFLMQMGILTVQEYLEFYLKDAIGPAGFILSGIVVADSPAKATSILFIPVLLGALISSLASGFISDMFGGKRKFLVYASGAMMATACVFFSITRSYAFDMFLGLVFGCGFGTFSVMDWAMATDVLPNPKEFAKDMGIWSLALALPQVIAVPTGGFLLDYFEQLAPSINLGYSVVFLLAVLYFVLGTWFVKYVDTVH